MSTLAVLLALTGTAVATTLINGASIKPHTVSGVAMRPGTLTSGTLATHSVTLTKLAAGVLPAPYLAGPGLSLTGHTFSARGTHYARVLTVAGSGGDFTSVAAAVGSITDAAADRRYLVWVAPGTYSGRVVMHPYVDLQGAGRNSTTITSDASSGGVADSTGATLVAASSSTVSDVTIENTATADLGMAVDADSSVSTFDHVRLNLSTSSSAANLYGLACSQICMPTMTDSVIVGEASSVKGVQIDGAGNQTFEHTDILLDQQSAGSGTGVFIQSSGGGTTLFDGGTIDVAGSDGGYADGFALSGVHVLDVRNATVAVTGQGSATAIGVGYSGGAGTLDMRNTTMDTSSAGLSDDLYSYPLTTGYRANVVDSTLTAETSNQAVTPYSDFLSDGGDIHIANSGLTPYFATSPTCINDYDASTFANANAPNGCPPSPP
jgi:hypothetical protein